MKIYNKIKEVLRSLWNKYWEIIIAVLLGFIVAKYFLPRILK